ncbi:hypothetical protein SAMN05421688_1404 [Poseidonocella pacifica]|uniref:Uncharacterized protein n=1 Tax=Poseidonocella pacifica TaxID=871651 RepID=A0A1I0WGE4_9RHOB|nr:hypothetical protein [Poseidonocella pacifica]SFA87711.1 hypothetical protein SAMN05421688_1404 [Poseidonocella pacifica]
MRIFTALPLLLAAAFPAAADVHRAGDWSAALIGQTCYVYSNAAARDTSGSLIFSFDKKGYNASFHYEYAPYHNDSGKPWDADDYAVIAADGQESWLGDEVFLEAWEAAGEGHMTGGFVADMVQLVANAQQSVDFMVYRAAHSEEWLYGRFFPGGFSEALSHAASWCEFNPSALPSS